MLFIEVLRRVLALAGVMLAAWTAIYYYPEIVQLHPIDVAREQAALAEREADTHRLMTAEVGEERLRDVTLYPEARMAPAAFLAHQMAGTPIASGAGPGWRAFIDGLFRTAERRPSDAGWRVHYGSGSLPDYLYFRRDDPRLQGVTAPLTEARRVMYLTEGSGARQRVVCATLLNAGDIPAQTSPLLSAPYRRYAPWCFLAGLLAYLLLPWPRRAGAVIAYRPGSGVIAPDWLGIGLIGGFFTLALLVVSRDSNFAGVMTSSGWVPLTAWSLCAILVGLPILLFSSANAVFALELLPGGVRVLQWGRRREIAYPGIEEADLVIVGAPRWLRRLSLLMLLVNALRAAPAVVLLHQSYLYLQLRLRDGTLLRLPYEGLRGEAWLLKELAAAGVALGADARETLALAEESGLPPRPQLQPRRRPAALIAGLALVLATGFFSARAPGGQLFATLPTVPKYQPTLQEIKAHGRILAQMDAARRESDAAFARYRTATGAAREAAFAAYQRALDRFMALSAQADALEKDW